MSIPALRHLSRPFDDTVIAVNVTQPFGHDWPNVEPVCWSYGNGCFGFHWEPGAVEGSFHLGTDYGLNCGTQLLAPAAGTVLSSGHDDTGFGLCTIIDHGTGLLTLHAHQSHSNVSAGQQVAARQQIGLSGGSPADPYNSGLSTGCHLHWATMTSDGRGYYYFFSPQAFLDYQAPAPLPAPQPAPTAGRYKVLVAMHLRAMPAKDAAQGALVNVGDILTADQGWTSNWRRCKSAAGAVGWAYAPNLAAA